MNRLITACILLFTLPGFSTPAYSCACCSEPGERFSDEIDMDDQRLDDLSQIKPGGKAYVFITNCGYDCIEGITGPETEYDVTYTVIKRENHLAFNSQSDPGGTIIVTIPKTAVNFGVDTEPDFEDYPHFLYKELRLTTTAAGNGAFAAVTPNASTRFILQGQGNSCASVYDFSHWHLSVKGDDVDFSLYGQLAH